ncbi:prolyl oligopeptidase family serine peptidase [Kribbella sp. NPDC006257]|uniref:S9 family peptidase n=1 Tax=Kribbella sp. NPDC006257 TaxID=3156738 RepID=UPI0033A2B843
MDSIRFAGERFPMGEDLPAQLARTRYFQTGAVSGLAISGRFVTFLRDGALWAFDTADNQERRVAAAAQYRAGADGIVTVLQDSELFVVDLPADEVRKLSEGKVETAAIDPTGHAVAFVRERALWVVDASGTNDRVLAEPENAEVSWGLPEFTAWMSMDRTEGFWWAPDGQRLLVARLDESPVEIWYQPDPLRSDVPPKPIRYPAAGTHNADVSLHLVDLDGQRVEVEWDRERFEYLVQADWRGERPLIAVQTRDQQTLRLLDVDPATGGTSLVREVTDPNWVAMWAGTPTRTASDELVWIERDAETDTYRLLIGDKFVTPPGLQVLEVPGVSVDTVMFLAQTEATEIHHYSYDGEVRQLSGGAGVHTGRVADGITVVDSRTLDSRRITVNGKPLQDPTEQPVVDLRMELVKAGPSELRTAVFRPSWHEPGTKLPVLLSPYAGPGFQLVMARSMPGYFVSQWFAEQGFIVLSIDGRGTPGRGPAWERAVAGDQLFPVLDDQIEALHAIAATDDDLDLERVAIRGWSFSGYLAAAAVIHRPDVFHAGIAGAPVTDLRLYDSYWKERYMGHPASNAEAYRRSSIVPYADQLTRPLQIIHGLADTNVWPVHSLRLAAALAAAGKPHELVTFAGQGHGFSDPAAVEGRLRLELDFLQRSLRLG